MIGNACRLPVHDRASLRRQRIVDAARMLFVTNGFHATGVAQIARESGIAVGQIYRDFEAKEDIVAAIVEGDCALFMARETLQHAISVGDSGAVWDWVCHMVQPARISDTEVLFAEIVAESARNDRIAAIFARTQEEIGADMRAALALLAPGASLARERELLSDFILNQSLGLKQHRLLRPGADTQQLVRMIVGIVARELENLRTNGTLLEDVDGTSAGRSLCGAPARVEIKHRP